MSVSTHGILSKEITGRQIYDIIIDKYDIEAVFDIKIEEYHNSETGYIFFKDGEDQRQLFYCITQDEEENTEFNNKEHVCLILGDWGNSVQIMTNIIKNFGGYIDENDCDDIGYYYIPKDNDFEYSE